MEANKMSLYKYVRKLWTNPKKNLKEIWSNRLIEWRKEPVTIRIERPTRIDAARSLGYKAKQGYVVVRQRLIRGGRQKPDIKGGRRPKHSTQRKDLSKNYQQVAEERANKKFKNCEVLNSYYVGKDGKHFWYEVILVDKSHPSIIADKRISWINEKKHTGRVFRGMTSAGRHSRGLRNKGKGAEKARTKPNQKKRRI